MKFRMGFEVGVGIEQKRDSEIWKPSYRGAHGFAGNLGISRRRFQETTNIE